MRQYKLYTKVGERAGEKEEKTRRQWRRCAFILLVVVIGAMAALGFAAFIWYAANFGSMFWTVSGVSPINGNIDVNGGAGTTAVTAPGTVTLDDEIVRDTRLPRDDAQSTSVEYVHDIAGPEGTWLVGYGPGFIPAFLPGIWPGVDGQGNVGGTAWQVPAPGSYKLFVNCNHYLSGSPTPGNIYHVTMTLQLGAVSEFPTSSKTPWSGTTTATTPSETGISVFESTWTTVTAGFRAGCVGCPFQVGDPLSIHVFLRQLPFGAPAVGLVSSCDIDVLRES